MKSISKILVLFIFISCKSNDCLKLPTTFPSYQDGLKIVENATFDLSDEVDTSKSSWIRGASYHSCNGNTGFLIVNTEYYSYVHQDVPIALWEDFKKANSFGSFYNQNLKGRYLLQLD
jgi:hypothetical protein